MRLRQQLQAVEQENLVLRREVDVLRGFIEAQDLPSPPATADWAIGLTPQEAALIGALAGRFPRCIHQFDLLEALPSQDHAVDRNTKLVCVKVSDTRRKLGADVIETVRGVGYRLSAKFYATFQKAEADLFALRATNPGDT